MGAQPCERCLRARAAAWHLSFILFLKLPDRVMVALARCVYVLALPFVRDEEDLIQVREWEKIFSSGPPLSSAVRRVVLEARPRQIRLLVRGILVHHVPAILSRKGPW